MSELANIQNSARLILDDTATAKFNRAEDLTRQISGTNKLFYLDNRYIASVELVLVDGAVVSSGNYTLNATKGLITLVAAPTVSISVSYYWQDFLDADLQDFCYRGLAEIGSSTGQANVEADLATVPEALKKAVLEYTAHFGFLALISKTARLFSAGAGKKNIDKDGIAKKYQEQAKEYWDKAELTKDNYYKKQGRQYKPAATELAVNYPAYTPRR